MSINEVAVLHKAGTIIDKNSLQRLLTKTTKRKNFRKGKTVTIMPVIEE